jgi:hypothetical protein
VRIHLPIARGPAAPFPTRKGSGLVKGGHRRFTPVRVASNEDTHSVPGRQPCLPDR